jgi:transcription elongation GreA/GreB family factor
VQDKLDDCEKSKDRYKRERKQLEEESSKELVRYKDLLSLREKEVDTLKQDLKYHIEKMERQNLMRDSNKQSTKETPNKGTFSS